MKNLIGLFVLIAVVIGCSSSGRKEETNANNAQGSNTSTQPETTSNGKTASLTLEKYNQLQNGMKYEEVVRILGAEGTETSSYSAGKIKTATYKWEGEKYARITATFRNGELASKFQSNLKSENTDSSSTADLTFAKYNQIQNGMSYEEVVKIIGSNGIQTSSSNVGQTKIASYKWEGDKYAKIFASFRNNLLSSKSQSNLK